MSREHFFETLSRRCVWQSRWYNVRQDQLRALAILSSETALRGYLAELRS